MAKHNEHNSCKLRETYTITENEKKLIELDKQKCSHLIRNPKGEQVITGKQEKEKLSEAKKMCDGLMFKLEHDKDMSQEEYLFLEVLDRYITIQSRLVNILEANKNENDLMKKSLEELKYWQDKLYYRIKKMITEKKNEE